MPLRLLRLAVFAALAIAGFGLAYAQNRGGDPPIIIGDGSLILKSPRAAWAQWLSDSGSERRFPDAQIAVASLRIESPGNDTTIDLTGRRTQITITSGPNRVEVFTFANGRGVRLRLRGRRFSDFRQGDDPTTLVLDTDSTISAIEVQREGQTILSLKDLKPKTTVTLLPPE
ncbi:MAG: hypothetical protein M9913_20255 [Bryobacteraceae bacterium]|nr:hypothetical protein [Solibacteraceae bacterium]MCL4842649.1 hypothetical protein [Bryobacteraceae bacterium]MCO5353184.1 hypothetical protein [Bryobacteraceae bacterium]